jgi:DNA-binding beta-propeller fold protein YncE
VIFFAFNLVALLEACIPQSNLLTSGGTWCYGNGISPWPTGNNGVPSNWPPLYQTGKVGQFNYQTGLAVNTVGSLMFVADTGQNLVRLIFCGSGTFDFETELTDSTG